MHRKSEKEMFFFTLKLKQIEWRENIDSNLGNLIKWKENVTQDNLDGLKLT